MSSIDIHLSNELNSYLKVEAARRGFRDPSEFVQSLLEAEQHRQHRAEIEAMLLDAVDGPFSDWTEGDVEDIRRDGRQLIERRHSA